MDLIISESENCYVALPMKTSPLYPLDKDPISHVIISPKAHFANFVEVDEQIENEYRNFQKSIAKFNHEELNMQTIFIETSIQFDNLAPHAYIDCVGVPNDLETDFDIELFFRKSLLEDDSEWG